MPVISNRLGTVALASGDLSHWAIGLEHQPIGLYPPCRIRQGQSACNTGRASGLWQNVAGGRSGLVVGWVGRSERRAPRLTKGPGPEGKEQCEGYKMIIVAIHTLQRQTIREALAHPVPPT